MSEFFTTKQASQTVGVPPHTVKYYCNKGLIPNVRRARNGYRMLEAWQVEWLRTLVFLRRSGLTLADLKKYVSLCRQGAASIPERKAMLETKKRQLWQQIEDLQENIDFIERRQELFDKMTSKEVLEVTKNSSENHYGHWY